MSKNSFKKIGASIGAGIAFFPFLALAQGYGSLNQAIVTKPGDIGTLLANILGWIAGIVFTVALIMLLYAAILYLTAGASETAMSKAKGVLVYAIVGIVVAILAYSVIPFLQNFLSGRFY
ncbi:MAG: hypothetical protein UV53_C0009G0023 [Candidatus Azambacteria bacterium GW2011_GWE1_42_9]|nr:MAG: hypothetical protein UV53_C0009G0023 [Candidatus Azambacteria bacterium GW2011_GWE1_42_9]